MDGKTGQIGTATSARTDEVKVNPGSDPRRRDGHAPGFKLTQVGQSVHSPGSLSSWRGRNDGPVYFRPVRSNPALDRSGVRRWNMT